MYVLRLEGSVAAGKLAAFEDCARRLGALLIGQPGFDRGALLNSRAYPRTYTRMLRFESREAARSWVKSDALARFLEANPLDGIYTPTRLVEAYELVHVVRAADPVPEATYAHLADWTIGPGSAHAAAFEAGRKELFELRRGNGQGYAANLLLRFLGGGGRYVMYSTFTDEAAAVATGAVPENRKWVQEHPASLYGAESPVQQTYDLVQAYRTG